MVHGLLCKLLLVLRLPMRRMVSRLAAARWRRRVRAAAVAVLPRTAGRCILLLRLLLRGGRALGLHLEGSPVRPSLLLLLPQHLVVEPLAVVRHRQLHVVVNGYVDGLLAIVLFVGVVELHAVGVPKRFARGEAPARVEVHAVPHEVERLVARTRKHLVERPRAVHVEALQHRAREGRLDGLDVLWCWASGHLHDAVQLVHS
mmetsp:Transcript_61736/g.156913  ORF Transcript_61736/g.156913 Transcript_61736/m.156913 type:complete len:202 (-) Transcript_61736:760-1365(-)